MPPPPPKPVDEEEDIFGDAGKDYVLELPKERAAKAGQAAQKPAATYFDRADDLSDLPSLPTTGAPLPCTGLHSGRKPL